MNINECQDVRNKKGQEIFLIDDFDLLGLMLSDNQRQPSYYLPGPYWAVKARRSANEIKKYGISEFRGSTNIIGLSYADNLLIDMRSYYNYGLKKILREFTKIYPLSILFEGQLKWTESYARANISLVEEILNIKDESKKILKKYRIPYSLLGKCSQTVNIDGENYSLHYINLLEQHDKITKYINFYQANSVFEIGGGFGANIHLLIENYSNIRKVLYLDIPPNLYVGTQYLKAFYGAAVFDYRNLRNRDVIRFSKNDNLEIFCITPWQIERFKSEIDIFLNSHSFVEMPKETAVNYVIHLQSLPNAKNMAIALVTYDGFDLKTTMHPNLLPSFFKDRKFNYFEGEGLLKSSKKNLYFLSPGKLSIY